MSDRVEIPAHRPLPPARVTARRDRVERYVAGAPQPGPPGLPRKRLIVAAAAGVVLLSGAATYVSVRPATVPVQDQTRCYTKASLKGGDRNFFGTTVGQARGVAGERSSVTAVDACAVLWRQGVIRLNTKGVRDPDQASDHPVPPLVACVLDDGIAAVLPGTDETCRELGISQLAE